MSLGDTVLQHFRELASLAPRRQSCYVRREGAAGCHAGDGGLSNRVANSSAITRVVIDASAKVFRSESSTW